MTIWIVAFLFLGLGAAIGFALGAIRATVCFIALLLGALLAIPFGPMVKSLIPLVGLASPVWSWILPPVVVLALFGLVGLVVCFFVQRPVDHYYRYKANEFHRQAWERLNQRLGVVPGLLSGLILFLALGVFVYVVGYGTLTFSADESEPSSIRLLNSMRSEMPGTGFDKLVAPFAPAPPKYYTVVDILGLAFRNLPKVRERVANYPPLYALAERSDVQDFASDKEYQDMLDKKAPLVELASHLRTQTMLGNAELNQLLLGMDLQDLRTYLESGKSPKYDIYQILGRWNLDVEQVLIQTKKTKPDISASEMTALRKVFSTIATNIFIKAFYDNRLMLVMPNIFGDMEQMKKAAAALSAPPPPPKPAETEDQPADNSRFRMSADYRRRYGMPVTPQAEAPAAPAETPAVKIEPITIQGSWEGEGESYLIKLQDDKGNAQEMTTRLVADEMTLNFRGQKLVFVKE